MSTDCVVDASVAIKLFVNEPLSDRADESMVQRLVSAGFDVRSLAGWP